jgi:hypothetical protein
MPVKPAKPIEIFYSYSHKDEELRDELEKHLSILKRQGVITGWHDRRIGAGKEWEGEIDEHLNTADVILLLISSDFLASDYCYDKEMRRALERHDAGEARVIPVILRPVDWEGALFGKLQALPKNAKPVTEWPNRDRAFRNIARGIRAAVEELTGPSPAPRPPAQPRPPRALPPIWNIPLTLKAAVFEKQLELIHEVEAFFKYKTSLDFFEKFAFDQMVVVNAWEMLYQYAQIQFGVELNNDKKPKIYCPAAHFHDDTPVIPLDSPRIPDYEEENDREPWGKYFHYDVVHMPKRCVEASDKVSDFLQSPLLPSGVIPLIKDFLTDITYNVEAVRDTMNECASKFPEAYPDVDSLKKFHTSWIWNHYIKRAKDLSESAQKILEYLREYLGTDYLFEQ